MLLTVASWANFSGEQRIWRSGKVGEMDELLALSAARAITYLRGVGDRSVFPDVDAVEGLNDFVTALPTGGTDPSAVIDLLDRAGSPATVATTGGRYFGFVTGGAFPVGIAASWLSATWDQNAALGVMSPTAAVLDTVVGGWLVKLLGMPVGSQHQFVTGTSLANSVCLAAGRDALLADQGWDSVNDGLFGAPPIRVVVSDAAHASVTKSLGFIGLGRNRVVTVPSDDQGRLDPSALPEAGEPTLVIAQAGNVNSGSFDPFTAIADHFEGTPHWIHIDGAFGMWAASSPEYAHLTAGAERAHSWATDLHKWLNTTYDSAVAVVRDRGDLARTFKVGAEYVPGSPRLEPLDRGPDMSQRARAVEAWAVLSTLGADGVAAHTERLCELAAQLAAALEEVPEITVCNEVVLNQILVRLDTDEATEALISAVQGSGEIWCSGSMWDGRRVMRISVCGHRTDEADIGRTAQLLTEFSRLVHDDEPDVS